MAELWKAGFLETSAKENQVQGTGDIGARLLIPPPCAKLNPHFLAQVQERIPVKFV